jgi:hypothetical protein
LEKENPMSQIDQFVRMRQRVLRLLGASWHSVAQPCACRQCFEPGSGCGWCKAPLCRRRASVRRARTAVPGGRLRAWLPHRWSLLCCARGQSRQPLRIVSPAPEHGRLERLG